MPKPVVLACICALYAAGSQAATIPGAISLDNIVTVIGSTTTTVDFNGITANPTSDQTTTPPAYVVAGYTFSDAFHPITNLSLGAFGGIVNDGTPMISLEPQIDDPLTMALAAGGTFAMTQIDASPLWKNNVTATAAGYPNATELDVTGTTSGGAKLTAVFTLAPSSFSTFTFTSAWIGLTSVVFTDKVSAAVPEPSSYALLTAGLVVLGVAVRRRAVRQSRHVSIFTDAPDQPA